MEENYYTVWTSPELGVFPVQFVGRNPATDADGHSMATVRLVARDHLPVGFFYCDEVTVRTAELGHGKRAR